MGDLRFAARLLRKNLSFTLFTVLLLSLSISAITVLFTAMNSLLLRPLPVRQPEQLVRLVQHIPRVGTRSEFPYEFYESLGRRSRTLTGLFAAVELPVPLAEPAPAEQVRVELVTPEFFETLGVPALLGRTLTRDDGNRLEDPNGLPPAVLSYRFWQKHFASGTAAIGQTVALRGHRFQIVGVMPSGFNGITVDSAPDLRVPLRTLSQVATNGTVANVRRMEFVMAGRLQSGVTKEQALAECLIYWRPAAEAFLRGFGDLSPKMIQDTLSRGMDVEPLGHGVSALREKYGPALQVLFASACLLLLLVCANLAGLLLARALARRDEIAVRLALGATRGRLIRQLLWESGLLTLLGATGGWTLAWVATPLLLQSLPPMRDAATRRVELALAIAPDIRVLLFALAATALTVVLFGLAPAVVASRTSLDTVLRSVRTSSRGRGRQLLVLGQVALCTVLLSGAALLVRTLSQLQSVNPGFDRAHIITFTADPSLAGYTESQAAALQTSLRTRVQELPQVVAAATATIGVMRGSGIKTTMAPAGQRITRGDFLNTSINGVSPEYFDAMGMKLLAGRTLTAADAARQKPRSIVINESLAHQLFPQGSPVGKLVGNERNGVAQPDAEIVGIVSDAKYRSLREPMTPTAYNLQRGVGPLQLIVRTRVRPEEIIHPVQQALAALDPALPFTEIHTLAEEVQASTSGERLTAILASAFGALAALLAGAGLYGVMAYTFVQRRREIGIRMALGAKPSDIGRLAGMQLLAILASGIILGLLAVLLLTPWLRALLFGISTADPLALAAAVLLVAGVALAATIVPLTRAIRLDPARTLRES